MFSKLAIAVATALAALAAWAYYRLLNPMLAGSAPDDLLGLAQSTVSDSTPALVKAVSEAFGSDMWRAFVGRAGSAPAATTIRVDGPESARDAAAAALRTALEVTWAPRLALTGRALPFPLVSWHPTVPGLLTVAASPAPSPELAAGVRPQTPTAAVVVDRRCAEAVLRGADVFAPGILCAGGAVAAGRTVAVWADLGGATTLARGRSLLRWRVEPGRKRRLLACGTALQPRAQMLGAAPSGVAVEILYRAHAHADMPPLDRVLAHVEEADPALRRCLYPQNAPSAVAALVLAPEPSEAVLDMCAAPGGKSLQLARRLTGARGVLVAVDKSRSKCASLASLCDAVLGEGHNVRVVPGDSGKLLLAAAPAAAKPRPGLTRGGAFGGKLGLLTDTSVRGTLASATVLSDGTRKVKGFGKGSFDRVLLDGPCSALGQRPRLALDATHVDMPGFAKVQKRLLRTAAALCKSGGVLVYSTCTVSPLENERLVADALRSPADVFDGGTTLALDDARAHVPQGCGGPGLPGFGLTDDERARVLRWGPGSAAAEAEDSIGFFVARFVVNHVG